MASNGDHVIDIIIETADRTQGGLNSARDRLLRFDESVRRTQQRLRQLSSHAYNVAINMIDNVTTPGSRINTFLHRLAGRAYNLSLRLNDQATRGIREVEARLFQLTGKVYHITVDLKNRASKKLGGAIDNMLGSTLGVGTDMLVGAGVAYGVYDTIKTYKDFEAQMGAVAAISGATGEELQQLTDKAMEMGAKTSFSASESGKAFEYMAMAGWKTGDMVNGIEGIMNLAAASGEDLSRVSDIVTDSLTAFGLQASDSAHFADVLAKASSNSNTNVSMMGETFKYVAPLAGALKYSIEDVGVAIGLMANAGIKGEQAGTSLRAIMTRLIDPPKEAGTALDRLAESTGIAVNQMQNADGTMKSFRQTMKELRTAFRGLSEAEKAEMASSIAGQEAMSGFLAVINASEADFDKLAESIDNADGAAKAMAETRMDNLAGDLKLLGSAWESFQLKLMQGGSSNFLRDFVQTATGYITKFTEYMEDGLDISDIGKLAMDIIDDLIDKFKALDGIGSLLAGGVLIGALGKIASKAMQVTDYLKRVGNGSTGGGAGGSAGGADVTTANMTVHAQHVTVNGPQAGGGPGAGPGPGPGPNGGNGGNGGNGRAGRMTRGMKWMGRAASVLAVADAAYDVYSDHEQNLKDAEEAEKVSYSVENDRAYLEQNKALFTPEEYEKYSAEFDKRQEESDAYTKAVEDHNTQRMNESIGSNGGMIAGMLAGAKGGAAAGGAIGAAFGGIGAAPGAAIGGIIGGAAGAFAGSELGGMIGANWEGIKAEAANTFEWLSNQASETGTWIMNGIGEGLTAAGEKFSEVGSSIAEFFSPVVATVEDVINVIVGLGAVVWEQIAPYWEAGVEFIGEIWEGIKTTAEEAWQAIVDTAGELWDSLAEGAGVAWGEISAPFAAAGEWFDSTVWQPISDYASSAWAVVTATIDAAWAAVEATWNAAAAWFDSTVWQPISTAVDSVKTAITSAFDAALGAVKGTWGAVAGWFESNVIGPIKEKFNALREIGSTITGLAGSGGGGGEAPHASGGIFNTPHRALVAEAGPEAIIPLSLGKRDIAQDLLEKTQAIISGNQQASSLASIGQQAEARDIMEGHGSGMATPLQDIGSWLFGQMAAMLGAGTGMEQNAGDTLPAISWPTAGAPNENSPQEPTGEPSGVSVSLGGVTIPISINGGTQDPQAIVAAIREQIEDIADDIGGQIADKISGIYGNQAVMNA